jgi:hypothetical protein
MYARVGRGAAVSSARGDGSPPAVAWLAVADAKDSAMPLAELSS